MDLDTVIQKRRSVRSYSPMAPRDRDIEMVVQAAELAPTAGNLKARKIFTIKGQSRKKELMEASLHQTWISEAPWK